MINDRFKEWYLIYHDFALPLWKLNTPPPQKKNKKKPKNPSCAFFQSTSIINLIN